MSSSSGTDALSDDAESVSALDASSPPQKSKPFEMLRSYTLADLFTLGNAACGTVTMFVCLNYVSDGHYRGVGVLWPAFALLPMALFFDAFDGYVARKTGRSSPLGADLDSLADIVSFGVAPAVLGFTLGLRGGWDMVVLVFFVVCGISRLARFNVTAAALTDASSGKVKYFEGTPIPTSLLLVLILGILYNQGMTGMETFFGGTYKLGWIFHPFTLIYAISGSLMISKIKVPKP
jgi:CDP-diacylglycerol--serine O-phosphatidyltransferase